MREIANQTDPEVTEIIQRVCAELRVPQATYRLQFHQGFTFAQATAIVPYLSELGISDCYASPILKSRAGSSHGYDICDHGQLNPELGSLQDFDAFCSALKSRNMSLILDMVPNHMGIGDTTNSWWLDVLENGPSSQYAGFFDIDWTPVKPDLENKVLLPILEDQYGKVLESKKLQLTYEDGAFYLCYYGLRLPIAPRTYSVILRHPAAELTARLGEQNEHVQELQSILTALSYLPSRTVQSPEKIAERIREKEIIKRRIGTLYQQCSNVRSSLDATLQTFNGVPGKPRSFDQLDRLIDLQPYRLAFWKVATEEINYRRFFDINELAAIRVEVPEVFQATHELVFRFLGEGKVSGLRIDHPDGLLDPPQYFKQLQENYLLRRLDAEMERRTADRLIPAPFGRDTVAAAVQEWAAAELKHAASDRSLPLYVVAEKILCHGESLPEDWTVHGTSGYDFLVAVNGLFVDANHRKAFDRIYHQFSGNQLDYSNLVNTSKKMIMLVSMAGEINALAYQLDRISEKNRWYRDFTLNSLTFAIREVIACLPVYRTYINRRETPAEADQAYVEAAVEEARRRNPRTAKAIFDFIRDTLLLRNVGDFKKEDRPKLVEFATKFQQLTGPVMAKGVEDTAFYVYNRLTSLNEVGGDPQQFGVSAEAFHDQNLRRRLTWPHSLLATSTHDTKRGEDTRARINVLSEVPTEWRQALTRWSRFNAYHKTKVDGKPAPDRNDEYLLYQTLIGAWPDSPMGPEQFESFRERILNYMLKATREAKVHTSWVNPNEAYDAAVQKFVRGTLAHHQKNLFLKDFPVLQSRVAFFGKLNSLAQLLLKLTLPGVPDLYQGTELWDYSLVDPDNRRPVDFQLRVGLLAELKEQIAEAGADLVKLVTNLLSSSEDGRVKLYVLHAVLNFRRRYAALFRDGDYVPLQVEGEKQGHVFAFMRSKGQERIVVIVPRLMVGLTGGRECLPLGTETWRNTRVFLGSDPPLRPYRSVLTGEIISPDDLAGLTLSTVFASFPAALLESGVR
ncbi:MAG: malto-oligosyltrehalose synthase [Acidobacteriota bacterium]